MILHGDCLDKLKEVESGSIDLILADPPYGTTACKWDSVIPLLPMWEELKRVRKENSAICLFGAEPFASHLRLSNIKEFKYDWTWIKENGTGFLQSKFMPLKNSETISVFINKKPIYNPQMRHGFKPYVKSQGKTKTENYGKQPGAVSTSNGERFPLTTLNFKRDKLRAHPTQKPVALLEYLIKTYCDEGATVLDFCMGSGSTGVAAKNTNRKFIGIEREAEYVAIAEKRIG